MEYKITEIEIKGQKFKIKHNIPQERLLSFEYEVKNYCRDVKNPTPENFCRKINKKFNMYKLNYFAEVVNVT